MIPLLRPTFVTDLVSSSLLFPARLFSCIWDHDKGITMREGGTCGGGSRVLGSVRAHIVKWTNSWTNQIFHQFPANLPQTQLNIIFGVIASYVYVGYEFTQTPSDIILLVWLTNPYTD
jgi:hypothetical protein